MIYTLPTAAQDADRALIEKVSAGMHRILRTMAPGKSLTVCVWREPVDGVVASSELMARHFGKDAVVVGTYTSAIDADALREDIEFAAQQL